MKAGKPATRLEVFGIEDAAAGMRRRGENHCVIKRKPLHIFVPCRGLPYVPVTQPLAEYA
ncbi:MAG: hypothetical protein ACREM2_11370 [Vulcanimicrobiaceae bacterium]